MRKDYDTFERIWKMLNPKHVKKQGYQRNMLDPEFPARGRELQKQTGQVFKPPLNPHSGIDRVT